MLYSEFITGTGCKDSPSNYEVYKRLEAVYMNDDNITKDAIYAAGKMLVDNSPTAEEIEFHNRLIEEMENNTEYIGDLNARIEQYEGFVESAYNAADALYWKRQIRQTTELVKIYTNRNKELQYILN